MKKECFKFIFSSQLNKLNLNSKLDELITSKLLILNLTIKPVNEYYKKFEEINLFIITYKTKSLFSIEFFKIQRRGIATRLETYAEIY